MMKFTRRSLPPGYLRKTLLWKLQQQSEKQQSPIRRRVSESILTPQKCEVITKRCRDDTRQYIDSYVRDDTRQDIDSYVTYVNSTNLKRSCTVVYNTENGTNKATDNNTKNGTGNSTKNGTGNSIKNGTGNSTKNGTGNSIKNGTGNSKKNGTGNSIKNGTDNVIKGGTDISLKNGTDISIKGGTDNSKTEGTDNSMTGGTYNSIKGGTDNSKTGGTGNSIKGMNIVKSYITPIKRKTNVTVHMIVWSNQLERIKRRTQSLREKDVEIRKKFEEIQKRAKRVFASTDLDDNEDSAVTPCKQVKSSSGLPVHAYEYNTEVIRKNTNIRKRPATPKRLFKRSRSAANLRQDKIEICRESKSASDISFCDKENVKQTIFSPIPNMDFLNICSESPDSPLLTVFRNGKKCTFC